MIQLYVTIGLAIALIGPADPSFGSPPASAVSPRQLIAIIEDGSRPRAERSAAEHELKQMAPKIALPELCAAMEFVGFGPPELRFSGIGPSADAVERWPACSQAQYALETLYRAKVEEASRSKQYDLLVELLSKAPTFSAYKAILTGFTWVKYDPAETVLIRDFRNQRIRFDSSELTTYLRAGLADALLAHWRANYFSEIVEESIATTDKELKSRLFRLIFDGLDGAKLKTTRPIDPRLVQLGCELVVAQGDVSAAILLGEYLDCDFRPDATQYRDANGNLTSSYYDATLEIARAWCAKHRHEYQIVPSSQPDRQ